MPKDSFKALTIEEQRFVRHYVREGATEDRIYLAERKSRLKKGDGERMLNKRYQGRFYIREEIDRRTGMVEMEQAKLDAKDLNRSIEDEDAQRKVTLNKIEAALDKVISLDASKHSGAVLQAIQIGLIYTGTIRSGKMERTVAPDPQGDGQPAAGGFYQSIFTRMRDEAAQVEAPAPLEPEPAPAAAPPPIMRRPAESAPKPNTTAPSVPVKLPTIPPAAAPKAKPAGMSIKVT